MKHIRPELDVLTNADIAAAQAQASQITGVGVVTTASGMDRVGDLVTLPVNINDGTLTVEPSCSFYIIENIDTSGNEIEFVLNQTTTDFNFQVGRTVRLYSALASNFRYDQGTDPMDDTTRDPNPVNDLSTRTDFRGRLVDGNVVALSFTISAVRASTTLSTLNQVVLVTTDTIDNPLQYAQSPFFYAKAGSDAIMSEGDVVADEDLCVNGNLLISGRILDKSGNDIIVVGDDGDIMTDGDLMVGGDITSPM